MTFLDLFAFLVLWWTAAATLAGRHEVNDWQAAIVTTALIALCVSSFACAVASAKGFDVLNPWTRVVIYAGSIVAGWLYDVRFGIVRHFRLTLRSLRREPHA
jgi:hypothetical protein